jgi:two-component system, cell cycle sensor histidine kinase and response regulator CckA
LISQSRFADLAHAFESPPLTPPDRDPPPACLHPGTPVLQFRQAYTPPPPPAQEEELSGDRLHAQRLEELGRLAAGIAHDVNNLLTVVLGETDLLLDDGGGQTAPGLQEIRRAALRARRLTQGVLSLSRRDDDQPQAVDVTAALGDMVGLLGRLAGPNIHLRARLEEGLPRVLLAPRHLDQVVMNLAVNARDAMPDGGTLTVLAAVDEGWGLTRGGGGRPRGVRIQVSDTGVGMDAATRRRIFDRFFTTKAEGKGTGLGLATVAQIVREAGGRVEVESAPGRGTTFTVRLPAAEPGPARGGGCPSGNGRSENGSRGPRPVAAEPAPAQTVLVVEDDEQVRGLVERFLSRKGLEVLSAGSAAEGLTLLEDRGPDVRLVLTDVNLPDMNGPRLWEEASDRVIGMRVIYMSGFELADLPDLEVDLEGSGFVSKPFDLKDLAAEVDRVLALE